MLILVVAEANVLVALYRQQNLTCFRLGVLVSALIIAGGHIALYPVSERVRAGRRSGKIRDEHLEVALFVGLFATIMVAIVFALADVSLLTLLSIATFIAILGLPLSFAFFHFRHARRLDQQARAEKEGKDN